MAYHTLRLTSDIERSINMIRVIFMVGLALADKLDRTYLPPPGFKFSGGSPGIDSLPFERPKSVFPVREEYSAQPEIAIGIEGLGLKGPLNSNEDTSLNGPSTYPQSAYTTTNSLRQTTTASPVKVFRTENGIVSNGPTNYSSNSQISHDTSNPHLKQETPTINVPKNLFLATHNYAKDSSDSLIVDGDIEDNRDLTLISSSTLPPLNNYFDSSSIPTTPTNNFVFSTTPSTQNFTSDFSTTKKYYSSSSSIPPFFLTTPKNTNLKQIFNPSNLKTRPERIQSQADRKAVILNYDKYITPVGYAYSFDTSNGIHADESGSTMNGVKAKGSYSYIGDDGKLYSVVYTADENGFQPQGEHLPTSPPIPDAILKVIGKAFKDKKAGIFDDGSYDENKYGHRNYQNKYYQGENGFFKEVPSFIVKNNSNLKNRKDIISSKGKPLILENQNKHKNPIQINYGYPNIDKTFKNQDSNLSLKLSQVNDSSVDNNEPQNNYNFDSDDETKYVSHVDMNESKDKHFDDNNRRKFIVNEQIRPGFALDEIDMLRKGFRQNEPDKDVKDFYTKTGYQYITPQNKFPSEFSGTQALQTEVPYPINYNSVTLKPFSNPFGTQIDGDIKSYAYNDKPSIDNSEIENYGEDITHKIYKNGEMDAKEVNNSSIFTNVTPENFVNYVQQPQRTAVIDQLPRFISDVPYMLYKSTTVQPSVFVSTSPTVPSTVYLTPSTYRANEDLHQTTYPSFTYTTRPAFTNGIITSQNDATSGDPTIITNDLNKLLPRTNLSTNNTRIGISYTPDININDTVDYKEKPVTEKNIGEDFSGPKQTQGFDPINGYYY